MIPLPKLASAGFSAGFPEELIEQSNIPHPMHGCTKLMVMTKAGQQVIGIPQTLRCCLRL